MPVGPKNKPGYFTGKQQSPEYGRTGAAPSAPGFLARRADADSTVAVRQGGGTTPDRFCGGL